MLIQKVNKILLLILLLFAPTAHAAQTVTYFHNDVAGTPLLATDASGNVVWKENYYPYGERLNRDTLNNNRLWFTGKPYDNDTGLTYLGARYYSPLLGRFMGVDPVDVNPENIHSFNRYAYANNNPYKFVDPDGKTPIHLTAFVLGFAMDIGIQLWGPGENVSFSEIKWTQAIIAGGGAALTGGVGGILAKSAIKGIITSESAVIGTSVMGGSVSAIGSAANNVIERKPINGQEIAISFLGGALGTSVGARLDNAYSSNISTLIKSSDGILNHIGETTRRIAKHTELKTGIGQEVGKSTAEISVSLGQKKLNERKQ
ncbi:RHS repeat-associated protein [Nitrosomonas ureae]|uniref:RHS repeat domain-containing protein n=1 Tax=Nitrosomonas ureae TaxID=44577 RepID=UPI000D770EAF|nr:RHS repeat-associated core domain-containing protein [Nitrosomonas ureae]PXX09482.1 RHS repeat-associated protein [Nitrosomonas ureae]